MFRVYLCLQILQALSRIFRKYLSQINPDKDALCYVLWQLYAALYQQILLSLTVAFEALPAQTEEF